MTVLVVFVIVRSCLAWCAVTFDAGYVSWYELEVIRSRRFEAMLTEQNNKSLLPRAAIKHYARETTERELPSDHSSNLAFD